ncbi:protein-L-isoaspartate(D-aspartate) O-methyltransferase [soil metagenome]
MNEKFSAKKRDLIKILIKEGINDLQVLNAINRVKREAFIPEHFNRYAYDNIALPIRSNQTISQPYTVAIMTQLLAINAGDKVLEIGTGSGYQAAILAEMGAQVYTVERIVDLYEDSSRVFEELGLKVFQKVDDGTKGWEEVAPFDKIIVTAGGPSIPKSLLRQLKFNGLMVIPVGGRKDQQLVLIKKIKNEKSETKYQVKRYRDFKFVPLVGEEGWDMKIGT